MALQALLALGAGAALSGAFCACALAPSANTNVAANAAKVLPSEVICHPRGSEDAIIGQASFAVNDQYGKSCDCWKAATSIRRLRPCLRDRSLESAFRLSYLPFGLALHEPFFFTLPLASLTSAVHVQSSRPVQAASVFNVVQAAAFFGGAGFFS